MSGLTIARRGALAAAGGFAPSDLDNQDCWFRASDIDGLADGASVSAWADSFGRLADASQATASKQPTYETGILNGEPAVRFDGVDDILKTSENGAHSGPITGFIVAIARGGAPSSDYWFDVGNEASIIAGFDGSQVELFEGAGTRVNLGTSAQDEAAVWAVRVQSSGNNLGYKNGGTPTESVAADIVDWADGEPMALGATQGEGNHSQVDLLEVVYYRDALTVDEFNQVGSYLADRYGLTWTDIS